MDYPVLGHAPDVAEAVVPHILDGNNNAVPSRPIVWGAPTAVASAGASLALIAANPLRKGLMIVNPVGNAQMSYDLSGGTVTLAGGIPLQAGDRDTYTWADCPTSAVTFIGTNAQSLVYVEGT